MEGFDLAVIRDAPDGTTERWVAGAWLPCDLHVADADVWTTFPGDVAHAVLAAAERYMRSAEGYVPTDARKDYLAERARVDKLTDALVGIAERMTGLSR